MKKLISSIMLVSLVGMIFATGVGALDSGVIGATVTGEVVAVTVLDGTVAYESMAVNTTKNTVNMVDTQTITNTGNVAEDFTIKGTDVSGGWAIGPVASSDVYFHGSCIDLTGGCDAAGEYAAMTNGYTALVSDKAPLGTTTLDLWINTPTVNTKTAQQAVNVTVLATKH